MVVRISMDSAKARGITGKCSGKAGNRDQGSGNSCLSRFVLSHPFRKEREMDGARSVFPVGVGFGVDREVHATAGQEAGATCSSQRARNGWGTECFSGWCRVRRGPGGPRNSRPGGRRYLFFTKNAKWMGHGVFFRLV